MTRSQSNSKDKNKPIKMAHRLIFLSQVVSSELIPVPPPQPNPELDANPDFILILAALCCALLGAIGLAFVVRSSCLNHLFGSATSAPPPSGLRRAALQLLPSVRYSSSRFLDIDCPICLAELSDGDLMRVLPLCGHVFHVKCIDTWLGCRSSCPSCRRVVVEEAARCRSCSWSQRRPAGGCIAAMVDDDRELGLV